MKKKIISFLLMSVFIFGASLLLTGCVKNNEVKLGGNGGAELNKYPVTSTSLRTTSSSTEKTFYSYDAKMVDYNITWTPTAANSVLTWKNYYSYDGTTFYPEDAYIVASTTEVTHGSSQLVHTWTSGGTTAVYKNVSNRELQAPWTKVVFGCETATGTVAVDIIVRNETK